MSVQVWLQLAVFMALLLAAALHGLAASGHFPAEHRSAALQTGAGRIVLFGSFAVVWVALAAALYLLAPAIPWYALVIGGGLVLLATPLLLRPLPNEFVDGPAALIAFAAVAVLGGLALVLAR